MWTLWLITYATVMGQGGGGTPAVTPMAIYQSQEDCQAALSQMFESIKASYGTRNTPNPGLSFCVRGTLAKK